MDGIEYEDWDRLVKDEYAEYCDLKREEQYDLDHGIEWEENNDEENDEGS